MDVLLFDIEADGLRPTKVHCIALSAPGEEPDLYVGDQVPAALDRLARADAIVAHNAIGYDLPVLERLHGFDYGGAVYDTLVLSRLLWSDRFERDARMKYQGFPTKYWGRHSLESYGMRMGEHKGEYSGGWEEYNEEMGEYCRQDVRVLSRLWQSCLKSYPGDRAVDLEHAYAKVIHRMNERGVAFDVEAAEDLERTLTIREAEVEDALRGAFDDFEDVTLIPPSTKPSYLVPALIEAGWEPTEFTSKGGPRLTKSILEGIDLPLARAALRAKAGDEGALADFDPVRKVATVVFNPGSRCHLVRALKDRGWIPTEFTPQGQAKLDETTLRGLDIPEAALIEESLMLDKRLGQLSRGRNAWLKLHQDGIMFPFVNHCGTVSFRCVHSRPNVSQVPGNRAPWGPECRSLWKPRPGLVLVGSDAASVELRILAHYLAPHDGGRLVDIMDSGEDPHEANRAAAGIETRDEAKTATYATLYGAGAGKIAASLGVPLSKARRIRQGLLDGLGVGALIESVKDRARERGALRGLDGRRIPVRKLSAALNVLIQSNASILLKEWTVLAHSALPEGAYIVLSVHDELQVECPPELVEDTKHALTSTLPEAGRRLGLRVTTPADAQEGSSWTETH